MVNRKIGRILHFAKANYFLWQGGGEVDAAVDTYVIPRCGYSGLSCVSAYIAVELLSFKCLKHKLWVRTIQLL